MNPQSTSYRPRPPLTEASLSELSVRYVGRFATTRAKLRTYLDRKVRERGWAGDRPPGLDALVEQAVRNGYVDDAAFAVARSRALSGRGYGKRRLIQTLHAAGVAAPDSDEALAHADSEAVIAALRFARRRRIGPFAPTPPDPRERERVLAAMVRAGHAFSLARAVLNFRCDGEIEIDELADAILREIA